MDPRTLFINQHGRLRSGLRILVFVLLFIAAIMTSDVVLYRINLSAVPTATLFLRLSDARCFWPAHSLLATSAVDFWNHCHGDLLA
jgi:hypothetical protein